MDESQTSRVTVEEAARLLGIEKGSVKKRIQRGKLRSEKDHRGTTWVYVDRSETVQDQSQGRSTTDRDELVHEMRERITDLRVQLEAERASSAELRRIVAALTQRIPEIEPPPEQRHPQHGQPEPAEPREETAESPAEAGVGVQHPAKGDYGGVEGHTARPWWRRMFGG